MNAEVLEVSPSPPPFFGKQVQNFIHGHLFMTIRYLQYMLLKLYTVVKGLCHLLKSYQLLCIPVVHALLSS